MWNKYITWTSLCEIFCKGCVFFFHTFHPVFFFFLSILCSVMEKYQLSEEQTHTSMTFYRSSSCTWISASQFYLPSKVVKVFIVNGRRFSCLSNYTYSLIVKKSILLEQWASVSPVYGSMLEGKRYSTMALSQSGIGGTLGSLTW